MPEPDGIFLIRGDGNLVQLPPASFAREEDFQLMLEKYPDLIPGAQIDPRTPRRWILVTRELGIATEKDGSDRIWLDHLFLDQDGIPTLIEVKRKSDTRARREVIAQMLDYAANANLHLPVQRIRQLFEGRHESPDDVLRERLDISVTSDEYWSSVKTNLDAGRLRLIFVADRIPPELQRIVEFLNRQTDPLELLAVEIPKYEGEGIQALVPRVLGQTVEARDRKSVSSTNKVQWDWDSFKAKLASVSPRSVQGAEEIIKWCAVNGVHIEWMQNLRGSFILCFGPFYPISVAGDGRIGWNAPHQGNKSPRPFDSPKLRQEILLRLSRVPGAKVDPANVDGYRALDLPVEVVATNPGRAKFFQVLAWIKEQMSESHDES